MYRRGSPCASVVRLFSSIHGDGWEVSAVGKWQRLPPPPTGPPNTPSVLLPTALPAADITHCDLVKSHVWNRLRHGLQVREHGWPLVPAPRGVGGDDSCPPGTSTGRSCPGATAVVAGRAGSPRRDTWLCKYPGCLMLPHNHRLSPGPVPERECGVSRKARISPLGVSRPWLCDPLIPGDPLLQGRQDPEPPTVPSHYFMPKAPAKREGCERSSVYRGPLNTAPQTAVRSPTPPRSAPPPPPQQERAGSPLLAAPAPPLAPYADAARALASP